MADAVASEGCPKAAESVGVVALLARPPFGARRARRELRLSLVTCRQADSLRLGGRPAYRERRGQAVVAASRLAKVLKGESLVLVGQPRPKLGEGLYLAPRPRPARLGAAGRQSRRTENRRPLGVGTARMQFAAPAPALAFLPRLAKVADPCRRPYILELPAAVLPASPNVQ